MILDYIQSLPAWDALLAWLMIFGAVGLTAGGFGLALVSKSCKIQDLKSELAKKDKQLKSERRTNKIIKELYRTEFERLNQTQERAG